MIMKKTKRLHKKINLQLQFLILLFIIITSNVLAIGSECMSLSLKKFNNKKELREKVVTSQSYEIQGKIINKKTGDIIPYCGIRLGSTYTGTSSNQDGEFLIDVDSLPVKLTFSHISYKEKTITVSKFSDLVVELSPLVNTLDEVVLETAKNEKNYYAINLAKKAIEKVEKSSNENKYGKAFYRQKSKKGEIYTELSEIIYDIEYSKNGINKWDILEGRYAKKPKGLSNKNYTLLSKILKSTQPDTDDLIFLLHPDLERFYNVDVIKTINSDKDKIVVLKFTPLKNLKLPMFKGEVYISTYTYDILKVVGTISHENLKLIGFSEKNVLKKNYQLSYEMVFKKDSILSSVIDYIKVDQEFDYYKDDKFNGHFSSSSNLTFFEYYAPTSRKRLGRQFSRRKSDWQKLDVIGYNEKFWEDNEIVKRTPVEKEVISSFKKDKAFNSIYLNIHEQIALMQSSISHHPFIKEQDSALKAYNNYNPVEKVYLHTDKDIFIPGENLWYSGYVVLGSNHYLSLASKFLYVDLIDSNNNIVASQIQEIIEGRVKGSFEIPKVTSGIYQLRSYTDWMRNYDDAFYFSKNIKVFNNENTESISIGDDDRIDLQFFPEGGSAVVGLIGKIAFKAIGNDGLGKKIKGKIINSKGEHILDINSLENGAGIFSFKPENREVYKAILEDNSRHKLPKALNQGYTMSVNNINAKIIRVRIQASEELKNSVFYLIGNIRNKKYFQGKYEFDEESFIDIEIPKNKLPSGVMTLTLFNENKKPCNERVLFINNQEELIISSTLNKSKFNARDKFILNINVTDPNGRAVSTDLSVAITDAEKAAKDVNSANILTQLLLESDMKGYIENPAFYFENQKRSTRSRLDLVMLTHGWRRFDWEKIMTEKADNQKDFSFSDGFSISGTARKLNNKFLQNITLRVIAKSKNKIRMYETRTGAKGKFSVDNISHSGLTEFVFNAYNENNKQVDVKITLDNDKAFSPPLLSDSNKKMRNFNKSNKEKEYVTNLILKRKIDSTFEFRDNSAEKTEVLEEINLIANEKKSTTPSLYGVIPDKTLYMKDNQNMDFLQRLSLEPGVRVAGSGQSARVLIRGGSNSFQLRSDPLWVIDGMPLQATDSTGMIPLPVATLSTFQIEKIDILKGASAAVFGARGGNGVIIIYTKNAEINYANDILSPQFKIMGYSEVKEFYSPKYDVKLKEHKKSDYRTTLYWNPSIMTDKKGNATVTFFNSDEARQIQIAIEGLSIYGDPGVYLQTFSEAQNE